MSSAPLPVPQLDAFAERPGARQARRVAHVRDVGRVARVGVPGEKRIPDAMRRAGKEREALAPRRSPDTFAGTFAGMEQGSAILCVDGGVAIPLARSGVQPFGARCVPCQRKYEAMHSMSVRAAVPL